MRTQQGQANDLTRNRFDQVVHEQYVAERLGHLRLVHAQKTVVEPIARERCAIVRAAALRQLVLVMREDEILTTRMNIDSHPKMLFRHRGTLDVPSRPAPAPRRIPARQFRR